LFEQGRESAFSEGKICQVCSLQHIRREVGIMSIVDDLAGEEHRIRVTSGAVMGYCMSSMGLW